MQSTSNIFHDLQQMAVKENTCNWRFKVTMEEDNCGNDVDIPLEEFETFEAANAYACGVVGIPYVPRKPCSTGDPNEINHAFLTVLDKIAPEWSIVRGTSQTPAVVITKTKVASPVYLDMTNLKSDIASGVQRGHLITYHLNK